jgi:hypothetical protein
MTAANVRNGLTLCFSLLECSKLNPRKPKSGSDDWKSALNVTQHFEIHRVYDTQFLNLKELMLMFTRL